MIGLLVLNLLLIDVFETIIGFVLLLVLIYLELGACSYAVQSFGAIRDFVRGNLF